MAWEHKKHVVPIGAEDEAIRGMEVEGWQVAALCIVPVNAGPQAQAAAKGAVLLTEAAQTVPGLLIVFKRPVASSLLSSRAQRRLDARQNGNGH